MKDCSKCGVEKLLTEFHKASGMRDGFRNDCKLCVKNRNNRYYTQNKEVVRQGINTWKENNSEKCKVDNKKYRTLHSKKIVTKQVEWSRKNRDKCNAANRRWRDKNQVKINTAARKRYKMRTLSRGEAYKVFEVFNQSCFKCGTTEDLTLDHFQPLSKGHKLSICNAIILCRSCNSSKNDKDPEEFFSPNQLKIATELISEVIRRAA